MVGNSVILEQQYNNPDNMGVIDDNLSWNGAETFVDDEVGRVCLSICYFVLSKLNLNQFEIGPTWNQAWDWIEIFN